ncbi:MAG: NADH-quinone oxidoreductase subunit C [Salinivirgaceae bacterium]|nr:NADH-quinone oxidoreductase subunit C [Salinivirgaceae bacterium]
MNYLSIKNNQRIAMESIPTLAYEVFYHEVVTHLMTGEDAHCVNYFGIPSGKEVKLICCIANDALGTIQIVATLADPEKMIPSLTSKIMAFHAFEREIHENFGIQYVDHPWLKPIRYPFDRATKQCQISNYPFYKIESEELHEVGVGPIHAGVIEPGHFRFICNGEQILHLEIQLGYQHRGLEHLFVEKKGLLQRATLAENIAGDTVVGHTSTFANVWESLCGFTPSEKLQFDRALALEHERIAIHTGDLSAICTDVAYQLGSSVFGRLRTPVINYFQQWCGNRLAKSLIRPGKTNFPFTPHLAEKWFEVFHAYEPHFTEMALQMFDLPSVLSRIEKTGVVSRETALDIGAVGMAARASGLKRDVRSSHPTGYYEKTSYQPIMGQVGDVHARSKIRFDEINTSIAFIKNMLNQMPQPDGEIKPLDSPAPGSFVLSMTEGWRGEICHCAITGSKGELLLYKIKDPSFHNWLALALAVRNNEISDFPICNKSFNLSYCGHDL